MTVLYEGDAGDPVVVVRSRLWQFNAIGLWSDDEALVIDPGIDPDEIALLRERVSLAGGARERRRITTVIVTHSHHDHIRGWQQFPGAEVILPRPAAEKDSRARARILAAKARIDERLGVSDPDFAYPKATRVFDQRLELTLGKLDIELHFLPGHSNCTSVVWIPSLSTLCSADYLVSPGLPYCRHEATLFEEALARLDQWREAWDIQRILPAHRELHVGREAVQRAIQRDRECMRLLRAEVRRALAEGATPDAAARSAARAAANWRGEDLGPRARQDLDNARRIVKEQEQRMGSASGPLDGGPSPARS